MKQIMSLFLVMLMVFACAPFALAQDTNGTVDDTEDVDATEDMGEDEADDDSEDESADEDEAEDEADEEDEEEAEDETEVEDEADEEDEEEAEEEEEVELEDIEGVDESAGITPDSPLWGLDRAMERIELALTFGKAAKAKKGLAHARERLMEVRQMIAEKRLDDAADAQEAHDEEMEEVEENVEELGNGDAEGELEEVVEIEEEVAKHAALVERVGEIKLKTKGLTEEQKAAVDEIVGALGESTGKMQVEIMQKKDRVKIKIKASKDMSDEDVKALEEEVKASVGDENSTVKVIGKANGKAKDKESKGKGGSADEEDEAEEEEEESEDESAVEGEDETTADDETSDDEPEDDGSDDEPADEEPADEEPVEDNSTTTE